MSLKEAKTMTAGNKELNLTLKETMQRQLITYCIFYD